MAQKLQCSSRRVDVLTGRWDKKPNGDASMKPTLNELFKCMTFLKHKLKEVESTTYLESSRQEKERLKAEISSVQKEIDILSHSTNPWKKWERKPKFSDKDKEEFK